MDWHWQTTTYYKPVHITMWPNTMAEVNRVQLLYTTKRESDGTLRHLLQYTSTTTAAKDIPEQDETPLDEYQTRFVEQKDMLENIARSLDDPSFEQDGRGYTWIGCVLHQRHENSIYLKKIHNLEDNDPQNDLAEFVVYRELRHPQ